MKEPTMLYRVNPIASRAWCALALCSLTLVAAPQARAASADANASATVIRPIAITADNASPLSFGNIVAGGGGTVVIDAAASPTPVLTGVTRPGTQVGTISAAKFDVSGEGGFTYAITLPAAARTLTSGSDTMSVASFTSSVGATGTLSGSLGSAGTQSFYVGGTLTVVSAQAAGTYVGTVPVSVDYN